MTLPPPEVCQQIFASWVLLGAPDWTEADRIRLFGLLATVRFYALRLHEAGMIKSTPSKIIGQGTDWRFFNELKRELKS
jgi:hypothetical protein